MNSQVEQVKDAQDRLRRLELFLVGANHLDGAWFGENHPDHIGRFWWRKKVRETFAEVREALASQPPVLDEREGWRPMDSAPKDRNLLLACDDFAQSIYLGKPVPMKVGGWHEDDGNWRVFGASWRPTHWRDLPEPPQVRAEIRNLGGPDDVA